MGIFLLACFILYTLCMYIYIHIYMCVYIVFSFLPLLYYLIKGLLLVVSFII